MLKIERTRQTIGNFYVNVEGQDHLVKTTIINTDNKAVSTVSENLIDAELYAKHRREMRKDENELRETRYAIEDAVLAEVEAEEDEVEKTEAL